MEDEEGDRLKATTSEIYQCVSPTSPPQAHQVHRMEGYPNACVS